MVLDLEEDITKIQEVLLKQAIACEEFGNLIGSDRFPKTWQESSDHIFHAFSPPTFSVRMRDYGKYELVHKNVTALISLPQAVASDFYNRFVNAFFFHDPR